jgi:hypothetical protein
VPWNTRSREFEHLWSIHEGSFRCYFIPLRCIALWGRRERPQFTGPASPKMVPGSFPCCDAERDGMSANRFKSWTETEERLLVALHESGMDHRLIAIQMRRTEAGIDNRLAVITKRAKRAESVSPASLDSPSPAVRG